MDYCYGICNTPGWRVAAHIPFIASSRGVGAAPANPRERDSGQAATTVELYVIVLSTILIAPRNMVIGILYSMDPCVRTPSQCNTNSLEVRTHAHGRACRSLRQIHQHGESNAVGHDRVGFWKHSPRRALALARGRGAKRRTNRWRCLEPLTP
jgi:hypothetical protein